ncbi:hypothetical protein, partial [Parasutterella excrementihominis]|uniref:hypothetical protein n=1 Tax=Parasutterella excrementihominis TaxID=487175 RepID=UPI0005901376
LATRLATSVLFNIPQPGICCRRRTCQKRKKQKDRFLPILPKNISIFIDLDLLRVGLMHLWSWFVFRETPA